MRMESDMELPAFSLGRKRSIDAKLRNETLSIFVANSGPYLSSDPLRTHEAGGRKQRGIGLANTSARLRALFDDALRFESRNWYEGGVEAESRCRPGVPRQILPGLMLNRRV